jgi:hypothetical protein
VSGKLFDSCQLVTRRPGSGPSNTSWILTYPRGRSKGDQFDVAPPNGILQTETICCSVIVGRVAGFCDAIGTVIREYDNYGQKLCAGVGKTAAVLLARRG